MSKKFSHHQLSGQFIQIEAPLPSEEMLSLFYQVNPFNASILSCSVVCVYRIVVNIDECPSRSCIIVIGVPFVISLYPKLWRRLCGVTFIPSLLPYFSRIKFIALRLYAPLCPIIRLSAVVSGLTFIYSSIAVLASLFIGIVLLTLPLPTILIYLLLSVMVIS